MLRNEKVSSIPILENLVLEKVCKVELGGQDALLLLGKDGRGVAMIHQQDCCEHVWLEDCEDFECAVSDETILAAELVSGELGDPVNFEEYRTYRILTNLASYTITWRATSNGYYSTDVDLVPLLHSGWGGDRRIVLGREMMRLNLENGKLKQLGAAFG